MKNFDCIFGFSVKSYVRNTINLSCAKILLTSVISCVRLYYPVPSYYLTQRGCHNSRTYALLLRTVYVIGYYVCQSPPYKWGSFAMSHLISNFGRSPKPAIISMVKCVNNLSSWLDVAEIKVCRKCLCTFWHFSIHTKRQWSEVLVLFVCSNLLYFGTPYGTWRDVSGFQSNTVTSSPRTQRSPIYVYCSTRLVRDNKKYPFFVWGMVTLRVIVTIEVPKIYRTNT